MIIIDANYILRWFLNDVPSQADIVDRLLQTGGLASVIIDRVTIAEVTYVLRSKQYDHHQVFSVFEELFYYPAVAHASKLDGVALELYRDTTLDFEDCILIARHKVNKYDVGTFDREMLKLIG